MKTTRIRDLSRGRWNRPTPYRRTATRSWSPSACITLITLAPRGRAARPCNAPPRVPPATRRYGALCNIASRRARNSLPGDHCGNAAAWATRNPTEKYNAMSWRAPPITQASST